MTLSNTGLDTAPAIESYTPEPTRMETWEAAVKNVTSVGLVQSEYNYYEEERKKNLNIWTSKDPINKPFYERYSSYNREAMDKLDVLYEDGRFDDRTKNFTPMIKDYLKFKDLQSQYGFNGHTEMINNAKDKAVKAYTDSSKVLEETDYWGVSMVGGMYGAMHDYVTLSTLPMGGWSAGRGILMNAARSFGQEFLIESAAQSVIAPTVYNYKKELGLKTSVMTEATNALFAATTAGTVRGLGSVGVDVVQKSLGKGEWMKPNMDLTPEGVQALKEIDKDLGEAYEGLSKSQVTQDLDEHALNIHHTQFDEAIEIIDTPNKLGDELNKAEPIPEASEENIIVAGGRNGFEDLVGTMNEERAANLIDEIPEALDILEEAVDEDAFRAMLNDEIFFPAERVEELNDTVGDDWKDQIVEAFVSQGYIDRAAPSIGDITHLKDVDISDSRLSFTVGDSKVKMTKNEDGTWTFDTSDLRSGTGTGGKVYDQIFSWLDSRGYKYKADERLSTVNTHRLPINLLKYRNKVGHSNWTVEDIDARARNLIEFLEEKTDKPLEKLTTSEVEKFGSEWGADPDIRINKSSIKLLQDYKAEDKTPSLFETVSPYDEMETVIGKNIEGELESKTFKELKDDLDVETEQIKRIEECLL